MDANIQDIAAVVEDALKEHRRMYDGFNADSEIFERQQGDAYVDINYKGRGYRIEVTGPFDPNS